jgi:hypothetical protein
MSIDTIPTEIFVKILENVPIKDASSVLSRAPTFGSVYISIFMNARPKLNVDLNFYKSLDEGF